MDYLVTPAGAAGFVVGILAAALILTQRWTRS